VGTNDLYLSKKGMPEESKGGGKSESSLVLHLGQLRPTMERGILTSTCCDIPRLGHKPVHFAAAPGSLLPRATVCFACGTRSDFYTDHFVSVVNAALFSSFFKQSQSVQRLCV